METNFSILKIKKSHPPLQFDPWSLTVYSPVRADVLYVTSMTMSCNFMLDVNFLSLLWNSVLFNVPFPVLIYLGELYTDFISTVFKAGGMEWQLARSMHIRVHLPHHCPLANSGSPWLIVKQRMKIKRETHVIKTFVIF